MRIEERRRARAATRRSARAGRRARSRGRDVEARSRSSAPGRRSARSTSPSSGSARTCSSADDGVDALVAKLGGELAAVEVGGRRCCVAGGGAANAVRLHRARAAGLGGFEFACAIPGTIGGGVWMNAGAYGGDFAGVLERVLVATADGSGWLTPDRARTALPALGAPARAGRPRRRAAAAAAAPGRDQSRGARVERAPEGGAADEPAHVRQRVQESRARAERRPDARGLRPQGPSHRRSPDLAEARELHRERRRRHAPRTPSPSWPRRAVARTSSSASRLQHEVEFLGELELPGL